MSMKQSILSALSKVCDEEQLKLIEDGKCLTLDKDTINKIETTMYENKLVDTNIDAFDKLCRLFNFDENGINKETNSPYDKDGYDKDGYDIYGYDHDEYDFLGYDRNGYDRRGYDRNFIHKDAGIKHDN